jgi:hypothetical protein
VHAIGKKKVYQGQQVWSQIDPTYGGVEKYLSWEVFNQFDWIVEIWNPCYKFSTKTKVMTWVHKELET